MRVQAEALTRIDQFAWLLAAALLLALSVAPVHAQESAVAKAAAWRIGDHLSLAGLLYAQGGEQENVDELIKSVEPLTAAMDIKIKPFPPRGPSGVETYAEVIQYLIKGDGAEIGRQIEKGFGKTAGALFEIAVKTNLMILLYEPGNDQGMADVIRQRCTDIALPGNLWLDLVNAVNSNASKEEVKDAVFRMHDNVAAYLGASVQ